LFTVAFDIPKSHALVEIRYVPAILFIRSGEGEFMDDTIAAISTPVGEGGIAIIRVSGPAAFDVTDRIFHSKQGRATEFPSHTLHFGTIGTNGDVLDHVMLAVMHAPRTYTKEDTCEINCHGGVLTARKILALCLQNGARLAEPGEFTKRAFLNGRLDLTQAEAVMDLIRAKSDRAHTAAIHELEGHLSAKINQARDQLVTILAHVEAHIDFPDDDIGPEVRGDLLRGTEEVLGFVQSLLTTAHEGKILREGISVAIVGRPNVGKSSLLNALVGQDRSIVTPVAGTTRDTIEESVSINGIPFRFTDTAGIRRTRRAIESIGVNRSHNTLSSSEIVLHVCDASRPITSADSDIMQLYQGKHAVLVLNKSDLPVKFRAPVVATSVATIHVSALRGDGLESLRDKLTELAYTGTVGTTDVDVAINERQYSTLDLAYKSLTKSCHLFGVNSSSEIIAQELHGALDYMSEIIGKSSTEDLLDKVFSTFCIGK
jgi:tRNA modification GTPase